MGFPNSRHLAAGGAISSDDENMDDEERKRRELHKSAAAEAPLEMTFQDEDATAKAPKKRITKGGGAGKGGRGRGSARSSSPPAPKKQRGAGSQSGGPKSSSVPLNESDLAKLPAKLIKGCIAHWIGARLLLQARPAALLRGASGKIRRCGRAGRVGE